MKKTLLLFAFVCVSMMGWTNDWTGVEWLGNGVGEGYSEKYKAVVTPALPEPGFINNLQLHEGVPVMHVCFPSAEFGTFSLASSQYDIEGAGVFFHLDAFVNQETSFTVECASVTYTFVVFYVDGTQTEQGIETPNVETKTRKVIENGVLYIENNGVRYNAVGGVIR